VVTVAIAMHGVFLYNLYFANLEVKKTPIRTMYQNKHFVLIGQLWYTSYDRPAMQQIRGGATRWCRVQKLACYTTGSWHQYIVF
jgi:hypothetical protein